MMLGVLGKSVRRQRYASIIGEPSTAWNCGCLWFWVKAREKVRATRVECRDVHGSHGMSKEKKERRRMRSDRKRAGPSNPANQQARGGVSHAEREGPWQRGCLSRCFFGGTFQLSRALSPQAPHLRPTSSQRSSISTSKGEEGVRQMMEANAKSFSSSHSPAMLPFSSILSLHLPKHAMSTTAAGLPNLSGRAYKTKKQDQ
ncbi:hypothetical protein B0H65DRAFT_195676 [Neurospora tetraspora]|uniref:Uncharacterized protein n=1 Tax=Neurospora tetraspora TaxID=94610 RepID=A0AAE0MRL2_9PEZI|nr:hypothetical protein B0H65DRAFT_195676 [Neurospora tetraspora]